MKTSTAMAEQLAKELISVQPIRSDLFSCLGDVAYSEKQLKEQGFRPVSRFGLLWRKDDNSN